MLPISSVATQAKNSLTDSGAFILFIEITTNDGDKIRIVKNNEDLIWNGYTWIAFNIKVGDVIDDPKGNLPEITLSVSNIDRTFQNYVETDSDFGSGWKVKIYVVRSDNLVSNDHEIELEFVTTSISANEYFVNFTLSVPSPLKMMMPKRKAIPNFCQAIFKDSSTGCTYVGSDTVCGKSFDDCVDKFGINAQLPFIGFPSMPGAILRKK